MNIKFLELLGPINMQNAFFIRKLQKLNNNFLFFINEHLSQFIILKI